MKQLLYVQLKFLVSPILSITKPSPKGQGKGNGSTKSPNDEWINYASASGFKFHGWKLRLESKEVSMEYVPGTYDRISIKEQVR